MTHACRSSPVNAVVPQDARATDVLDFWFGKSTGSHYLQTRAKWFRKGEAFDARIRQRFGAPIEAALLGECARWAPQPLGALAEVVVPDPFTFLQQPGSGI